MKTEKGNLADQLEIWGIDNDFTIFTDGSLGFGLELTPIDMTALPDTALNSLSSQLGAFLNGLGAGIDLQFVQDVTRGNEEQLSAYESKSKVGSLPLALDLGNRRIKCWRETDESGLLPRHRLRLFVRTPMREPLSKKGFLFSNTELFSKITESKLKAELIFLEKIRHDISDRLSSLGVQPKFLSTQEVIDLLYRQWNPLRPVDIRDHFDPDDVRPSLLYTDVLLSDRGFQLGGMHYRVISLKILPEQTYASIAQVLRNLPFNSRLQLSVHVPEQGKEIERLKTQRRLTYSIAYGSRGMRDVEGEAKYQDIETLLENLTNQGERIFLMNLMITLRSVNEEELDSQVSETLATLRDLGGAEGMEESLIAFDLFTKASLPNARATDRIRRMKTSNLADLMPIFGPWKGHESPSVLLQSTSGNLVPFDPFASELTSANQIICGTAGSGKSFLTNALLLQLLRENPRVFIVDIGGSYKKLCENLGGQYLSLSLDSDFAFNPFDLPIGETRPDSQKTKFLLGLVDLMTREDGEARLPKLERAEIEEAIQSVFQDKNPSLSALRDRLLQNPSIEIRRIGRILGSWCGNTPYGKFFDRATQIDLRERLVCFDLKGLEDHPDLQAVFIYVITDYVWREVQRDRDSKKFLILDECWRLLDSESGSAFVGEIFRTFRKYRASAVAISQNIDDFAQSKVANAILSNSPVRWILTQKGADPDRLRHVLGLNENELHSIQNLRKKHGVYSEAYLIAGDHRSVVAVTVTPLEYWIATSDPRDAILFKETKTKYPDLTNIELLELLAEKHPHGASGATIGHSKMEVSHE